MGTEKRIIAMEPLTGGGKKPLHRRIYEQIRQAILEGHLLSGDRLPATRELAAQLGLARNTVARAYEDLSAEGYLDSRVGSGTRVSAELILPLKSRDSTSRFGSAAPARSRLAKPASSTAPGPAGASGVAAGLPYDFRPGSPDWEAFPRALWLRLLGRALRTKAAELNRYGEPAGYFPLRQAIARHLTVSRAVRAGAEQVVIVSGSQQALALLVRLRTSPGDTVALEDPGYPEARLAFASAACRPLYVPVDEEGLNVGALARQAAAGRQPRLLYVTPSHQFPTGATLSLGRRLGLLDWAARRDVLILEDDYDSEFRSAGRLIESLQGLDRAGRVVYLGTFSTVLFPPLRVGYAVLPPNLIEAFTQAKWLADRQTATLEQLALAEFLEEGHFERHLRRMRRLVAARLEALRAAIQELLGDQVLPAQSGAGMHLMLRLADRSISMPAEKLEALLVREAARRGVGIYPLDPCRARPAKEAAFLLGYASLAEEKIQKGIALLAEVLRAIPGGRAHG